MSRPPDYFDELYSRNPDPWGFTTSPYERDKYQATLAALPKPRYGDALEIGCSIGVFTHLLSPRCDRLLAIDGSSKAIELAQARCVDLPHVTVAQRLVPEQWPSGARDLILFAEVLYFLEPGDIERSARLAEASLAPDGCILLVNWLGSTETTLGGDAAAGLFLSSLTSAVQSTTLRRPEYRLDRVWR